MSARADAPGPGRGHARRLGVVAAGALALLAARGAGADPAGPQELGQARARFQRAEMHYRLEQFDQALQDYVASYRLSKRPALLFNVAQCHRHLEQRKKAVFYYRLYLADWRRVHPGTAPPFEGEVRQHIAALSGPASARQPGSASQPSTTRQPAQSPSGAARARPGKSAEKARGTTDASRRPPIGRPTWRRTAAWAALGLGGASLLTGAVLGGLAQASSRDYEAAVQRGTLWEDLEPIDARGRRYEGAQIATLTAGAALLVVGGALLIWDYAHRQERRSAAAIVVVPTASHGGAGLMGAARF